MRKILAFFQGMLEFRSDVTTSYSFPLIESYDAGREFAHILTFRRYDR